MIKREPRSIRETIRCAMRARGLTQSELLRRLDHDPCDSGHTILMDEPWRQRYLERVFRELGIVLNILNVNVRRKDRAKSAKKMPPVGM